MEIDENSCPSKAKSQMPPKRRRLSEVNDILPGVCSGEGPDLPELIECHFVNGLF